MSQPNKRKYSSGKRPGNPSTTKKPRQLTADQALLDIRKDWHIVKLTRKKDQKYKPFLQNKAFILQILGVSKTVLSYLPNFQDDEEVVHDAILYTDVGGIYINTTAFNYASERIQHQIGFVKEIRDYIKNEKGANRLLLTFEKMIPGDMLRQLEPFSRHWLDKAILDGDFDNYQNQAAHGILPKRREKLIADLLQHFLSEGRSTPDKGSIFGYEDGFAT